MNKLYTELHNELIKYYGNEFELEYAKAKAEGIDVPLPLSKLCYDLGISLLIEGSRTVDTFNKPLSGNY